MSTPEERDAREMGEGMILVGLREDVERLEAERDVLRAALRAVVTKLDYLRGLWGDEAITRRLADHCREALAETA